MIFFAVLVCCIMVSGLTAQTHRCNTMEVLEKMKSSDPKQYGAIISHLEHFNKSCENINASAFKVDTIVVPIVFHVLYHTDEENVPDEVILEQLRVLNEDFGRYNADTVNTPSAFKNRAGGLPIKFVMARRDPNDLPFDGINRVYTNVTSFFDDDRMKFSATGGADAWDSERYLNFWCCNLGGGLLGYAQFPGGDAATDGVVILYSSLPGGSAVPFDLGRTATHEIGHLFDLFHIWGDDGGACSGSDQCSDTPNQGGPTSGCPSFPETDNCAQNAPGIMFQNYMDYTDDACYNLFTKKQVLRMYNCLTTIRTGLGASNADELPLLVNNNGLITEIIEPNPTACNEDFNVKVRIRNIGLNTINKVKIGVEINNFGVIESNIDVAIEPLEFVDLELGNYAVSDSGTYSIEVSIIEINELPDTILNGNTKTKFFRINSIGKNLPLSEDFESVNTLTESGIELNNPDDDYTFEKYTEGGFDSNQSVYIDFYSYSDTTQTDGLVLPMIDFSNYDSVFLSFDKAYQVYDGTRIYADGLGIEVSLDCGISWIQVFYKEGHDLASLPDEISSEFFPEGIDDWNSERIDLSLFVNYDKVLVRFKGYNDFGNNLFIDNINIEGIKVTGVLSNVIDESMIAVFPNPATQKATLRINAKQNGNVVVQLQDITGRILESSMLDVMTGNQDISLNLKGYASGSYFVTISEGNYKITKKLLVY